MLKRRTGFLVLLFLVLGVAAYGIRMMRRGFSARDNPSAVEAAVARTMRLAAIPSGMKNRKNPFQPGPELLREAMIHFADHCATCHGNDGSGNTTIGQNVYPKAPDMRLPATQKLSDGELYYIIHNGIRLSGMPAWGQDGNDEDSWKLVLFIRHLPQLTPGESKEMKRYNPRSVAESEEEQQEEEFLNGGMPNQPTKPHHR